MNYQNKSITSDKIWKDNYNNLLQGMTMRQ